MAVNRSTGAGEKGDLVHQASVFGQDPGIVHHFTKAKHPLVVEEGIHVRCVKGRAGGVEFRSRHAGGHHEEDVQGKPLGCAEHEAHAVVSQHIDDFVRIRHHRRRASGQHDLGILGRREEGGFYVHMGVDKARSQVLAIQIKVFPGLVIVVKPYNEAVFNRDAGVFDDSAAQDIDEPAAGDFKIAEGSAGG